MPTKKYIKSNSDDPFERATGNKLYAYDGKELNCLITPNSRMLFNGKQHMARYVAASIYLKTPVADLPEVETTCNCSNCVLPSHLIVGGQPLKTDEKGIVITGEAAVDAPDEMGEIHGCSPELWNRLNDYQKGLARKGYQNPAMLIYEKE